MSKVLGITDFAKRADIEAASARVMLRKLKVKKKNHSYEFKDVKEIDALIAKGRAGATKPATKKAPAKKTDAKKAVKKAA